MHRPDDRFRNLTFEGFRLLATDSSLSIYEKIGFPDSYRKGLEPAIFADIRAKARNLDERGKAVLDVGPGCSELPKLEIEHCRAQGHALTFVDSQEMLNLTPDQPFLTKVPGRFPEAAAHLQSKFDVVLAYSVLHYVFVDGSCFDFVDRALALLKPAGELLIGDVPNVSMRKRFLSSDAGREFHRKFMGTSEPPKIEYGVLEPGQIDDAAVLAILHRCRASGFDAYVLPQAPGLPMANRREDILVRRP